MDNVFQAVNGRNFSFAALVRSSGDNDFVVFANGNRADLCVTPLLVQSWFFFSVLGTLCSRADPAARGSHVVLFPKFLAKRRAHDRAADAGRSAEVRLARLPARRVKC